MRYKKIRDVKTKNHKIPYRELEIKADEIPNIDITGEQYLYINTRHGTVKINAIYNDLRITISNPTDDKITIAKSKRVDLKVEEY